MKRLLLPLILMLAGSAHAYTAGELLEDCRAAEQLYAGEKNSDPYHSLRSGRCIAYVAGFADGYAVGDYLADKVGVQLNAICLPNDPDLSQRLVRAVVIHTERMPPQSTVSTATVVAGALAKAFPCSDPLVPKK